MAKKNENKHSPLSDSVFYIMISLIKPMHGYAIMHNVEEISDEQIKIGPATLYTSLTKLQENKWIISRDDIQQSDERRKPYILTEKGKEMLRAEVARRNKIAQHGLKALEIIGGNIDEHNQ